MSFQKNKLGALITLSALTLFLVIVAAIVNLEKTIHIERKLNRKIGKLEATVSRLTGFLEVPRISGIQSLRYKDSWMKVKNYNLIEKTDLLMPARNPPKGWSISNCHPPVDIDSCLPFPWPEKYLKEYNHPFNPWTFQRNIEIIVKLMLENKNSADLQNLLNLLVQRSKEYSEIPNETGRFASYNFDHTTGPHSVKTGWVSSYGNGRLLQAFSLLYYHFKNPKYLETANEYFQAFTEINFQQKKVKPKKWFSFVDHDEYLWLEELPLEEEKKSHILNGHIQAIRGLYFFWMVTKDKEALKLLQASLLTMHRYGNAYRIPGKINRYDLYQDYNMDYSPFRSISQQKFLYSITGEVFFKNLAEDFATDMRWHK